MLAAAVLPIDCPEGLQEPLRTALLAVDLSLADASFLAPEVLIVWLDPRAPQAPERLAALRRAHAASTPAVIVVAPDCSATALRAAARIGADSVTGGADPDRLAAVCVLTLGCARRFADLSPLTGLPGNAALQQEIERRLPERGGLAVLAFDLDEFKSYNDRYGYYRGDALLRYLGQVIVSTLSAGALPGWFAAHVGGDDFFALVRPLEAERLAREAIDRFSSGISDYYDPADRARGAITVRTRGGEQRGVPLATLTVAAVTNEAEDLTHPGQLSAVLAELKAYGKARSGSNYLPDRRRTHHREAARRTGEARELSAERGREPSEPSDS